jgi:hypothetical protein
MALADSSFLIAGRPQKPFWTIAGQMSSRKSRLDEIRSRRAAVLFGRTVRSFVRMNCSASANTDSRLRYSASVEPVSLRGV